VRLIALSRLSRTELNVQRTEKLRAVLATLPKFCAEFFRGIEPHTTLLTRINYAYDIRLFFSFLEKELGKENVMHMSAKQLEDITLSDLERYIEYLRLYYKNDQQKEFVVENSEKGIKRKISSLRTFYHYFYNKEVISSDITSRLQTPKIHEKPILRLTHDEAMKLLYLVETGDGLTPKQREYHKKTVLRDMAIITLLLTTGIRISELCALDVSDFDFASRSFKVLRKGGNEALLYFGTEAEAALTAYIEQRKAAGNYSQDSPMFLSLQNRRISVRALQELVKKYASIAVPLKNISPHKLRSTYGTMLYQSTGDIYLVADVLGHKDVNTTRKHYAAVDEETRRLMASDRVQFRTVKKG
jgi:integrase/recombinase XerC